MLPNLSRLPLALSALVLVPMAMMAQSPRMVLVEEATNASCPPCAAQNPFYEYYLELPHNEATLIPIAYHANWPGRDVMNAAAKTMHDSRVSYYSVSGVPTVVVNGKVPSKIGGSYDGSPADTAAIKARADQARGTMSPITLTINQTPTTDGADVTVQVASTEALDGQKLRIAVVEATHHYDNAGTNGEKDFPYVVRAMLPDYNGTAVTVNAGESTTVTGSYTVNPEWNAEKLYVVAWVQDDATKEVMQAGTDRNQVEFMVPGAATVRNTEMTGATMWQGEVETMVEGDYTVTIDRQLPAGWNADVMLDHEAVVSGNQVTLGTSPSALDVSITPAESKSRVGHVTVTIDGPQAAHSTRTYTLYAGDIDALVLLRDEGNTAIADAYEKGMADGNVTYAVVPGDDEHLFNWSDHDLVVYEVGKSILWQENINELKSFIDKGGRLFLIGAEIAWGLADPGAASNGYPSDVAFLGNYLHAKYVKDTGPKSGLTFIVNGAAGDPIGDGLSFSISNGVQNQDTPDEIAPMPGAVPFLYYGTTTSVAGIRYSDAKNRLVYLGFGAEGIGTLQSRTTLMTRGVDWLMGTEQTSSVAVESTGDATQLGAAMPNPSHGTFDLPFTLERSSHVTLDIYAATGERVATAADASFPAGRSVVRFDGASLPTGLYTVVMHAAGMVKTSQLMIVR